MGTLLKVPPAQTETLPASQALAVLSQALRLPPRRQPSDPFAQEARFASPAEGTNQIWAESSSCSSSSFHERMTALEGPRVSRATNVCSAREAFQRLDPETLRHPALRRLRVPRDGGARHPTLRCRNRLAALMDGPRLSLFSSTTPEAPETRPRLLPALWAQALALGYLLWGSDRPHAQTAPGHDPVKSPCPVRLSVTELKGVETEEN